MASLPQVRPWVKSAFIHWSISSLSSQFFISKKKKILFALLVDSTDDSSYWTYAFQRI